MSFLDKIFSAVNMNVIWAAFNLDRPDNASAQVMVLVDPATGEPYSADPSNSLVSREPIVTRFVVKAGFLGAAAGDVLTCTQVLDLSVSPPTTIETIWRNQTSGEDLPAPPNPINVFPIGAQAISNEQLRATPVPVDVTSIVEAEVSNDSGNPLWVAGSALSYTNVSVASLSGGQAAGTSAILAAKATRRALMINPPADCVLTITSGASAGMPLYGGVPNLLVGAQCPANAIFLSGLSAGQAVTVWEA